MQASGRVTEACLVEEVENVLLQGRLSRKSIAMRRMQGKVVIAEVELAVPLLLSLLLIVIRIRIRILSVTLMLDLYHTAIIT